MADDLTQGLGIDSEEMQRRARLQGALGMSDSAVGPPPTPRIPSPSANDKTPPVTLRGISPQTQQRTSDSENELSRLQSTGSGISQIQNPTGRRILKTLDTIGSIAAPNLLRSIPGTELHHQGLLGQQREMLGQDLGNESTEAGIGEKQAQAGATQEATAEMPQKLKLEQQREEDTRAPKPKEEKWSEFANFTDSDGTPLVREENSGQVVRANDKKPPTGFKATKPDQPFKTDKTVRVVNGVPHEIMVDAQTGADVKDLGQTKVPGESPETKRNAAESAQVEREARQHITKASEQYRATEQSVNQLLSSIDQAKDGNGLLTSFVPTMEVLGINASNGVHRISPAEAQAAGMPGGWSERFNAWFDKASTGELSPQLQSEGKALAEILRNSAYQRYKSTYTDESGIVSGYGGTDFGKRVPMIQGGGADAGGQPKATHIYDPATGTIRPVQ